MLLDIYSPSMEKLGIIEKMESLIWIRRYWEPGEFKLLVAFTPEANALLKTGNIVMKEDDSEAAYIQFVHISKNREGYEVIEVQGHFLTGWIGKRVIVSKLDNVKDTPQHIIQRIVRENAVAAENRKIPRLAMGTEPDLPSENIAYTSKDYANALDAIEDIAKDAKIGFRIRTNQSTLNHSFYAFAGLDKTERNARGAPPCIFSRKNDNVLEQEFSESTEKYLNTAYVEGEEREDKTHLSSIVNDGNSGLDRNEMFVSGLNIKQTYKDDSDTEVTMTDAEYIQALDDRGREKLEAYPVAQEFSSVIDTNANLRYREDFDIGDEVTCVNEDWNVRVNTRITEITEIYEVKGMSLEVRFGDTVPSIYKQMKTIAEGG